MKYGVPRHPDTFEALPIRHLYVRSDRSENRQVLEGRLGIRPIDASTGWSEAHGFPLFSLAKPRPLHRSSSSAAPKCFIIKSGLGDSYFPVLIIIENNPKWTLITIDVLLLPANWVTSQLTPTVIIKSAWVACRGYRTRELLRPTAVSGSAAGSLISSPAALLQSWLVSRFFDFNHFSLKPRWEKRLTGVISLAFCETLFESKIQLCGADSKA